MISKTRFSLLLPLIFVVASGCASKRSGASVHGKVTYQGNPVSGTISFYPKGEELGGGQGFPIKAGGVYEGSSMPAGEYVVSIETESSNPNRKTPEYGQRGGGGEKGAMTGNAYAEKMKQMGKAPTSTEQKGEYVKIPDKYNDKTKSGLTVTLKNGKNEKDFNLD